MTSRCMGQVELVSLVYYRDRDRQYVDDIVKICRDIGIEIKICEFEPRPDMVIVLGGDGSILQYIHDENFLKNRLFEVPIYHIGTGKVNFFSDITISEINRDIFIMLKEGRFYIDVRKLLKVNINGEDVYTLNEVVMRYINPGKIIEFTVQEYDGDILISGRMDGIIVATSTGSTAYLLALGGPAVDYRLQDVKVIVPVAPFSPALVPIIHPLDVVLEIKSRGDCIVVCDGILYGKSQSIKVERADVNIKFARTRPYKFYERLCKRLLTF